MPHATTDDGVRIYYEESGGGHPVLFVHEFAGDHRSWRRQLAHFEHRYRCIVYNARGYPPSDVPEEESAYSQARAVEDALAVLDHLGLRLAHVVGLSMGGFCALHLGLTHPERASALVVAGCGYGAGQGSRERFRGESEATARALLTEGMAAVAESYALGPARVQLQNKDRAAWEEFKAQLSEHSALGSAYTLLGVQRLRPSLYDLGPGLARLRMPTLVLTGDEDEPCLEPDLMLKRAIPTAGLEVLPRTGHACNLEEPDRFNAALDAFFAAVESGRWQARDPRSVSASLTGMPGATAEPGPPRA